MARVVGKVKTMVKAGHFYRLVGIASLLALGFCALMYTLFDLQVNSHEELRALAQKQRQRVNIIEPLRGKIKDIQGNPLALSHPAKVVCVDPTLIGTNQLLVAKALAPILKTNESYLIQKLTPTTRISNGKVLTNQYALLKRKVTLDEWAQCQQAMTNLVLAESGRPLLKSEKRFIYNLKHKALFTEEDQIRVYPSGMMAAHVLGFTGGEEDHGLAGVELSWNSKLTGVRGWRTTEAARNGRELVQYRNQDVEARNGYDVVLTLDAGLQHIVEEELAEGSRKHSPISISCMVVRPKTGEILAMATLPTYDPNRRQAYPESSWRNRVIADQWEPGSTFKIVVVSGALNEQKIKLTDPYFCENGHFYFGGRILHDHDPYGTLTVEGIITKSSNIGSAKIAIDHLGNDMLYQYVRKFGFGSQTGIPLPGEESGIVYSPKSKWWNKVTIAQIPMGHGIAATPLQTLMAMSAIANKGKLMRPLLVKRLENEFGKVVAEYQPQVVREVVSEYAARDMVTALKSVVETGGTGTTAKMDNYTVAGKTGTAQKVEPGVGYVRKYYASFIGFFPADDPELCISVVLDEPKNGYYGGQTAGPTFKRIAERAARYLNIRPDIQPDSPVKDPMAITQVKNLKETIR